jgi:hypothetical protein
MDHPFSQSGLLDSEDGNDSLLLRLVKQVDHWALENPGQAAVVGAVLGIATSALFNRLFLLRGTAAALSCLSGAVKGAVTGYTYPTARGIKL